MRLDSVLEICALVGHLSDIDPIRRRDCLLLAALHRNRVYAAAGHAFSYNEKAYLLGNSSPSPQLYSTLLDDRQCAAYSHSPTWIHIDSEPQVVGPRRGGPKPDDCQLRAIIVASRTRATPTPGVEEIAAAQKKEEFLDIVFPGYSQAQRGEIAMYFRNVSFIRAQIPYDCAMPTVAKMLKEHISRHSYRFGR